MSCWSSDTDDGGIRTENASHFFFDKSLVAEGHIYVTIIINNGVGKKLKQMKIIRATKFYKLNRDRYLKTIKPQPIV